MNYIFILIEVCLVYSFMILFYKIWKKDGLLLYIGFMASILCFVMFKNIDIISFPVDMGIPIVMGIFTCSNIIIQRYGNDETMKITRNFGVSFVVISAIVSLFSLVNVSENTMIDGNSYDYLFGYSLINLRIIVSYLISIGVLLWYNSYVYYFLRKNDNKLIFSNIGSIFVIQFIESIIFVFISYFGLYEFSTILGMVAIRYLLKIIIGIIGLIPVTMIMRFKDK